MTAHIHQNESASDFQRTNRQRQAAASLVGVCEGMLIAHILKDRPGIRELMIAKANSLCRSFDLPPVTDQDNTSEADLNRTLESVSDEMGKVS